MKQFLPVVWWLTATLVIAFVLVGLGYLFADALLLGVLFLPGMLTARYFVPQLSFENRRQGILDTVYLALAILAFLFFLVRTLLDALLDEPETEACKRGRNAGGHDDCCHVHWFLPPSCI